MKRERWGELRYLRTTSPQLVIEPWTSRSHVGGRRGGWGTRQPHRWGTPLASRRGDRACYRASTVGPPTPGRGTRDARARDARHREGKRGLKERDGSHEEGDGALLMLGVGGRKKRRRVQLWERE